MEDNLTEMRLINLHRELWIKIAQCFARDKEMHLYVATYKKQVLEGMYKQAISHGWDNKAMLICEAMDSSNCFACVYSKRKSPFNVLNCRYCPFKWRDYEIEEDEAFKCYFSYYGKFSDDFCCKIDWKKCCKLAYKIATLEVKTC